MKLVPVLLAFGCFLVANLANAQWQTTTYSLKGGWNAINLTGDAAYDTLENLMPSSVLEVWRWNPNPTQIQFINSPLEPTPGTPEWSVWRRGLPSDSTISQMTGPGTYLIKCSGTAGTTSTLNLKQSPKLPANVWVRSGANLLGFPARGGTMPTFSNFFSTFPVATAASAKIYKYAGGDLGAGNPIQVFSTLSEPVDRTKAYWFSAKVVGNFYAPIEVNFSAVKGLDFSRTGSVITAYLKNRTSAPVTLTFAPVSSESAPINQPSIVGPVPLTRRFYNTATLEWMETPVTSSFTEVLAANSSVELSFGINRTAPAMMSAASNALFASFLRLTDSTNLIDIYLPTSASKVSLAGLWVGDISLKQAGYAADGAGNTAREMPLRTLIHMSDSGTVRLLSQVFLGQLAAAPYSYGICTDESLLKADTKATAQRLVAAHMPLDQAISAGSGSLSAGSSLVRTIQVPFNSPTNPFVHQYHPDHDNKDPRGNPLPAGVESFNINRTCTFTFTATPPAGSGSILGWGSNVIGGNYSEIISGLHRNNLQVTGTFTLRRASELGTIYLP
jgi:hypothetical protein